MSIPKSSKEELSDELSKLRCKHSHSLLQHPACFPRESKREKVIFLDIETDGLEGGDYNKVYSWSILQENGKIIHDAVTIPELNNVKKRDRRILIHLFTEIQKLLEGCDVLDIVTYYGARFDFPMLLGRLCRLGIEDLWPNPKTVRHIDLYDIARKLRMAHRRLNNMEELLYNKSDKTRMTFSLHDALDARDPRALKWVLEHNDIDVRSTKRVWDRLRPFASVTRRWL